MRTPIDRSFNPASCNRGFSLIELMIALTLGLIISAAVYSIFLGSSQGFRTGQGVSEVQEQGRFANLLVNPIIRLAGYVPDPVFGQSDPTLIFLAANNEWAIHGTEASGPSGYPSLAASAAASNTDTLAVTFVGRGTSGSTTDMPLKTCLGDTVYANQMAVNVFYIGTADTSGTSSLHCYTNITSFAAPNSPSALSSTVYRNEPLVAGVSNMQVLYSYDTNGDGSSFQYLPTVAAPTTLPSDWTRVKGVKVTFTIDSADVVDFKAGTSTGRIRRTFTTWIQVRNRLHN